MATRKSAVKKTPAGIIVPDHGPVWTTACPDWEDRLMSGASLIPFDPLFPGYANKALEIFNQLVAVDVAGSPTFGEISRDWLHSFVAAIFGCYDEETGKRLIREFFLLIAKKNGKSTTAAGIMLTALILNWRPSAELYILAPTKEIADNSFFPARDAVRADDDLKHLFHIQEQQRTIKHRQTNAFLKVVAADSETVAGKKSVIVLVDELWLFGKKANSGNMLREATGGLVSRPEGFIIYLSTQSDEVPVGVFEEKLDYARDVRDGKVIDPQFLPVIYEFSKEKVEAGVHHDLENLKYVNPNYGASVDLDYLKREHMKADRAGKHEVNSFFAKHANIQVGQTTRVNRWVGVDVWPKGNGNDPEIVSTLDEILETCDVVESGVDGGGLDDLLSLSIVGRNPVTGAWLAWAHAWLHPIGLERRKDQETIYRGLEEAGFLTIVEQAGNDIVELADHVERCEKAGLLDCVGVDPENIGSIVDELIARKIDLDRIKGVSQGYKLMGAIKTVERKLSESKFIHRGNPLLNYAAGNARTEKRGNAILITKAISGSAKIDPLMATFNAVTLLSLNPKPRRKSYKMLILG